MVKAQRLSSLPVEILTEIFEYLNSSELINLTLTCKVFNSIISYSKILLSRLTVTLNSQKSSKAWIGSRKYQKVQWNANLIYFPEVFESISDSLTDLRVCFLKELKVLLKVLQKCKNLKKLFVDFGEVTSPLPERYSLTFLKTLDELKVDEGIFYMKIFENIQVKKFYIKQGRSSTKVCTLRSFLANQTQLTSLELLLGVENLQNLFYDGLFDVKFRLKHFSVIYLSNHNFLNEIYHENFLKFHQKSLESLEISDARLHEGLKKFNNLKKLDILVTDIEDLVQLDQIENLKINLRVGGCWSEKFPNVKNLQILAKGYQLREAEKLEKLEKISVTFNPGWDHHTNEFYNMIDLPRVKTVEIVNFKLKIAKFKRSVSMGSFGDFDLFEWDRVKSPFEEEDFKVENLILKNCHEFGWLGKYLKKNDTNLKSLRVEGTRKLTKKVKKVIKKKRGKIEKINFSNDDESYCGSLCFPFFP